MPAFARERASVVLNWLDDERAAGLRALRCGPCSKVFDRLGSAGAMLTACATLSGVDVLVDNAAVFPRVDFWR